jgi:hypothetical protein
MEFLGSSRCNAIVIHLPLADHVRNLDAGQDGAFDGAVVLLDDVVPVFVLPDLDRR